MLDSIQSYMYSFRILIILNSYISQLFFKNFQLYISKNNVYYYNDIVLFIWKVWNKQPNNV